MKEPNEGAVAQDRIQRRNDQDFTRAGEDELQWLGFYGM
jgi:hypothetical protein